MESREKKLTRSTSNQEFIYYDGGTLTHYLGNDDYKEGNRESDEWSEVSEEKQKIGYIALGNENMFKLKKADT